MHEAEALQIALKRAEEEKVEVLGRNRDSIKTADDSLQLVQHAREGKDALEAEIARLHAELQAASQAREASEQLEKRLAEAEARASSAAVAAAAAAELQVGNSSQGLLYGLLYR